MAAAATVPYRNGHRLFSRKKLEMIFSEVEGRTAKISTRENSWGMGDQGVVRRTWRGQIDKALILCEGTSMFESGHSFSREGGVDLNRLLGLERSVF